MPVTQSLCPAHELPSGHEAHVAPPQSTSVSSWFNASSSHVGSMVTTTVLLGGARHVPEKQFRDVQSSGVAHASPVPHGAHTLPPQSTDDSPWLRTPSLHVAAAHRCVELLHTKLAQSPSVPHVALKAQPGQPANAPPQSTSASSWFNTPSLHVAGRHAPVPTSQRRESQSAGPAHRAASVENDHEYPGLVLPDGSATSPSSTDTRYVAPAVLNAASDSVKDTVEPNADNPPSSDASNACSSTYTGPAADTRRCTTTRGSAPDSSRSSRSSRCCGEDTPSPPSPAPPDEEAAPTNATDSEKVTAADTSSPDGSSWPANGDSATTTGRVRSAAVVNDHSDAANPANALPAKSVTAPSGMDTENSALGAARAPAPIATTMVVPPACTDTADVSSSATDAVTAPAALRTTSGPAVATTTGSDQYMVTVPRPTATPSAPGAGANAAVVGGVVSSVRNRHDARDTAGMSLPAASENAPADTDTSYHADVASGRTCCGKVNTTVSSVTVTSGSSPCGAHVCTAVVPCHSVTAPESSPTTFSDSSMTSSDAVTSTPAAPLAGVKLSTDGGVRSVCVVKYHVASLVMPPNVSPDTSEMASPDTNT